MNVKVQLVCGQGVLQETVVSFADRPFRTFDSIPLAEFFSYTLVIVTKYVRIVRKIRDLVQYGPKNVLYRILRTMGP
jgi:hypothetical protein